MGKRSQFERIARDFYPTPFSAAIPLLPYIGNASYVEPCAGDGTLIKHIPGECVYASDIEPQISDIHIHQKDALTWTQVDIDQLQPFDWFITNPPWSRDLLHPLIEVLSNLKPTWLLFDADWMHTRQASHFLRSCCRKIVSVGRVKWIPGSPFVGKDNCCWYMFDHRKILPTHFIGRA